MKSFSQIVTMRDVAKAAGVSQSTVSRVLSEKTSGIAISEETCRKVMDAVEALGYYPNLTARSLRTNRTHMIAVMIADISNPFYHHIVRTIQDISVHHDYDVLISNTDHVLEYEQRFCEAMMRRSVDGIILVPFHLTGDDIDRLLHRTGAAITALGRHLDHPGIDVVSADDEQATYDTIRWLIEVRGHHRIAYIGVSPEFMVNVRRYRGYQRAMRDAGLEINAAWVIEGDFTAKSGQQAMQQFLTLPNRPSAVFACNDAIAIGALNMALDAGLKVPDDIAVMGFDNIPSAALVRPTLTTIAQFPVQIGRLLAQTLFERIDQTYTGAGRRFDVPCQLIERQSA